MPPFYQPLLYETLLQHLRCSGIIILISILLIGCGTSCYWMCLLCLTKSIPFLYTYIKVTYPISLLKHG